MGGRLEGKVALVTGGAAGIGEGTVRRFVAEGARCMVVDLDEERGRTLADDLGSAAAFARADVTVEEDVASAVDRTVAELGRLDCMFNNAGILGAVGPIVGTSVEAWDTTLAVLLRSVFLGIKHAARVMIPQGSGTILSTASTAGVRAGLGPHAYTAAKHGVVGLTGSVAPELGRHGIRVNCIAPGGTVTAMTAYAAAGDPTATDAAYARIGSRSPLGRPGHVDDIAAAALFLASDDAAYVSGACLVVDAASEVHGAMVSRWFEADSELVGPFGSPPAGAG